MTNAHKSISKKAGLPPGALIHIGKKKTEKVRITVIDYSEDTYTQRECSSPDQLEMYLKSDSVSWINIDGIHDVPVIEKIGQLFGLHALLLEDVLNTQHRPKVEGFGHCVFVALKMLGVSVERDAIISEQVSFVLGRGWIISFQEQRGDIFDGLRSRLRDGVGLIRSRKADYLFYRLIDTVVDNYFFVTEYINDVSLDLEERVISMEDQNVIFDIQRMRKRLIRLRKSISPLREVIAELYKDSSNLVEDETTPYLRDVYEHVIQVNESLDTQRDIITSIMEMYQTGVSNRMNQVMKVLTIIATIFIPLTFIAGIYGMNFDYMPELQWDYGYFAAWGVMVAVTIGLIVYFKRKNWL